jgi:hypothetical protein
LPRSARLILPLLLGSLLFAATPARASSPAQTLREAESLLGGGAVVAGPGSARQATLVLRELSRQLPRLGPGERRRAERLLRRPSEGGDEDSFGPEDPASPRCSPNFCVHWGTANGSRPPAADSQPANDVPDFVDETLAAATRSHAVENVQLGWRRALSDGARGSRNGRGGAGQVDIYLSGLGRGLFGYATSDPSVRGRQRPAYLVIDNDYKGFGGSPLELMRVTIAHEYNHVLQFAYDTFQDGWMFESTATWVEDHVYPDINDYFNFLPPFYANPGVPVAERDSGRPVKIYGSALWNHWLDSRYGPATIRDAWAASTSVKPADFAVAAYNAAITANGGRSFSREFGSFAAATAELNSPGSFPDAGSYGDVKRSGKLGRRMKKLKLDHTAYRLFKVRQGGTVRLIAKVKRGTRAAIALVGSPEPGSGAGLETSLEYLKRGGRGSVKLADTGRYARVTAVLVNADGRVKGGSRNYRADRRRFKAKIR